MAEFFVVYAVVLYKCLCVLVQLASGDDVMGKPEKDLHPHNIDAFWLQRKLSKYYDDPMVAQTKANEVLNILKVSPPLSLCPLQSRCSILLRYPILISEFI